MLAIGVTVFLIWLHDLCASNALVQLKRQVGTELMMVSMLEHNRIALQEFLDSDDPVNTRVAAAAKCQEPEMSEEQFRQWFQINGESLRVKAENDIKSLPAALAAHRKELADLQSDLDSHGRPWLFYSSCYTLRTVRDDRPSFDVDPAQPFVVSLGRGSGWHGLRVVKIQQDGTAIVHRLRPAQSTTLMIGEDGVADVLRSVSENGLIEMQRAYHDDAIIDGTQWVLLVKQGEAVKSIYFNNYFPRRITAFAQDVEDVLARSGLAQAEWVPDKEAGAHQKELWDSLRDSGQPSRATGTATE
jgi:hypothetical protein